MKLFSKLVLFAGLTLVISCDKNEGPGGSSTITGLVHAIPIDGFGNPIAGADYMIAKEDIFIIYGAEGTVFDDDVETSYDGRFEFNFLEKGSYQIFCYEKAYPPTPSGKKVVLMSVEITEKKSTVDIDTIHIFK